MLCWFCGKNTMTLSPGRGKGWCKCSECGTTWIDMSKLKSKQKKVKK